MRNEVSNACVRVCVCVCLCVCCLISVPAAVVVWEIACCCGQTGPHPSQFLSPLTRVVFIRFVSASISFNVLWRDVP